MNCLSHAWKYLDDPWFAAGTCLPDWLGMMERKNKFRRAKVSSFIQLNEPTDNSTVLAQGILKHLADDAGSNIPATLLERAIFVRLSPRRKFTLSHEWHSQSSRVRPIANVDFANVRNFA